MLLGLTVWKDTLDAQTVLMASTVLQVLPSVRTVQQEKTVQMTVCRWIVILAPTAPLVWLTAPSVCRDITVKPEQQAVPFAQQERTAQIQQ